MGKAENVVWHNMKITREEREELLNQKGWVLWFTGLSGSGKSTIANEVEVALHRLDKLTYSLDGDNLRHGLNKDLGFSLEDRKENIRRVGEVSKLFADAGVITLCTFISPTIAERDQVRNLVGDRFVEIYVACPLEVCEQRDPKQLYAKARRGEIKQFTGIDSPYEAPVNAEIVLESHNQTLQESVAQVLKYLKERGEEGLDEF